MALGNPEEAARRLGIAPELALSEGLRLSCDPKVVRRLRRRSKSKTAGIEALAGLRRLAFGRINDALELLSEDPPANCGRLDLFNVSEIKRVKGGGVEIRFFDRLEALEKLAELETKAAESSSADSFFDALKKSARETAD